MVQRKKIELTIPTIDLSLLKKIKGGYSIDPAYCIDSNDSHWYVDKEDYRDEEQVQLDDNIDSQYESVQENESNQYSDSSILQLLKNSGVSYQFNQSWLNEKSKANALGAVVYKGDTLPDGSIAEQDTIILGNNATESTVREELFHIWQGKYCYEGDGLPTEATGAMELMDSVFDYVFDQLYGDGYWPSSDTEQNIPSDIQELIMEHLNGNTFDVDGFAKDWDEGSYFESWKGLYEGHLYGSGSDDDFNYKWSDAYNWWLDILGY